MTELEKEIYRRFAEMSRKQSEEIQQEMAVMEVKAQLRMEAFERGESVVWEMPYKKD